MKWTIDYSRDAEKVIQGQRIDDKVKEELKKFLIKMKGGNINIDLKKLRGDWTGYYRLRKGKLRIIFELNNIDKRLFVEKIDQREDVYK